MQKSLTLLMLCGAVLLGLASCAPANVQAQGGPSFIQMPLNQPGLVGATPQILDAAFGKPAILRTEGTAQVWLYQDAGCGLNLVLYPDNTGIPRVAMAAPTGQGADPAACSASLARDHVAALSRPVAQNGIVQLDYTASGAAQPISDMLPAAAPPAGPSAAGPALDGPGSTL